MHSLPTTPHPYSCWLIAQGAAGDKAGSICKAGKNTANTTARHKGKRREMTGHREKDGVKKRNLEHVTKRRKCQASHPDLKVKKHKILLCHFLRYSGWNNLIFRLQRIT